MDELFNYLEHIFFSVINLFVHYLLLLSFSFLFHCFYCCFLFIFVLFKLNTKRSEQSSIECCFDIAVLYMNAYL